MRHKKLKSCLHCSKMFLYKKSKSQKYCSKSCYDKSLITRSNKCHTCSKKVKRGHKYCTSCKLKWFQEHCSRIASLGGKKRWEGHVYSYKANGYIMIKVPGHPYANKRGYIYDHRLVMEKHLRRYLSPNEVVHHKDGDKTNNVISNLVRFNRTNDHTTYHLLKGDIHRNGKNKIR